MNPDFDIIADTPDVNKITVDNNYYVYKCPHCGIPCITAINEVNCKIFRCGIYKHNGEQVEPHLSKYLCDALKENDKIWGCGKPFQLVNGILVKCEYL